MMLRIWKLSTISWEPTQLGTDFYCLYLLGTHLKYYFDEIQDMIEDVRTLKKAVLSTSIPSPPKQVIAFYFTSNSTWSLYTMIYIVIIITYHSGIDEMKYTRMPSIISIYFLLVRLTCYYIHSGSSWLLVNSVERHVAYSCITTEFHQRQISGEVQHYYLLLWAFRILVINSFFQVVFGSCSPYYESIGMCCMHVMRIAWHPW